MNEAERRAITRRIAGFPLTNDECDVAELVAARVLEETFSSQTKTSCCGHPIIGLPMSHPNNHYGGCADQNPLSAHNKTWTPFSMDAQPRLCPHDGVVCRHDCEGDECWRELDGS